VNDDLAVASELTTANDVLSKLKMDDLLKLVQSLPNGYRTVFNLYVIEGFPHKEIADMLNITEGTSKSQLARAKAMLQKMVQENY
jgi:RNA polymerase sigma-70 factor (ECF subfamily)